MLNISRLLTFLLITLPIAVPLVGESKRLWILSPTGEMAEYDSITFALKQKVKLPPDAAKSYASVSVNSHGEILFAPAISLPLSESDLASPHKVWIWNGHAAAAIDQPIGHKLEDHGSNQAVTESVPVPHLSADGDHLFWFANEGRRLQREDVDLSTSNQFEAWQTDLAGKSREEITSAKLPDCRCTTGSCEETCPSFMFWAPEPGIQTFFLATHFVAGQTATLYKESARYQLDSGKWTQNPLADPLQRVLDANSSGSIVIEAIPDNGCCGWSNQSNDQTLVVVDGKARTIFDERASYQNPDYDVSFYTANARLSPDTGRVAMTIVATAQSNKPIQLSQQGETNPEESQRIRKSLLQLPAVEVKTNEDAASRIAFIPHAALIGWISEKELLILENHLLVAYNLGTGARRRSTIRAEDAAHVFLR